MIKFDHVAFLSVFLSVILLTGTVTPGFLMQDAFANPFVAVADGSWFDVATWGGAGPGNVGTGVTVTIPAGRTVTLPSGIENSGTIIVQGTLSITNPSGTGIAVFSNGVINNSGQINVANTGGNGMKFGSSSAGTMTNSGTILITSSSGQSGIVISGLGLVTNTGTIILANAVGTSIDNVGTFTNNSPGQVLQRCGATYSGLTLPINQCVLYVIADQETPEGDLGDTIPTSFTVSLLDPTHTMPITVKYGTADDMPASATADVDYVAVPPTLLTFAPLEDTKTVFVDIIGDDIIEPDEFFQVVLSGASGPANLVISSTAGSAIGAILNDDTPIMCLPGTFSATGFEPCIPAQPGYYVDVAGATTQTACSPGTTSSSGATQCISLPPTAVDDSDVTDEDISVTTNVLANDANLLDAPISVAIETLPSDGSATVNDDNTISYNPNLNFNGADSYQYRVTDASGDYAIARVDITVNPVNDVPSGQDKNLQTNEDTALDSEFLVGDPDFDLLQLTIETPPTKGTIQQDNGCTPDSSGQCSVSFTYTPNGNANGPDSFRVKVSDGMLDSFFDVFIEIIPINDPPTATDDGPFSADQEIPIEIPFLDLTSNDSDGGDGGPLVITSVQNPQNGNAVLDSINSKVIFTPNSGFSGATSFEYVIFDGADTDTGLVTIDVVATVDLYCGLPESAYVAIINGTSGNDNLVGTPGNDLIRGFGGDDKLRGKGGNDCLIGGDGKDKIWGGKGDDKLEGNEQDDKLFGGEGNDSLLGGAGDDRMWGGKGIDTLDGDSGDDRMHGNQDNDTLYGGQGNDWIGGGIGNDTISGGDGNDKIFGRQGADTLSGDSGNDRIHGGHGSDDIDGGAGTDRCKGGSGKNNIANCEDMTSSMTEEDDESDSEEGNE